MKWVVSLLSSLGSVFSYARPVFRWLGQPQPVIGGLLILLGLLTVFLPMLGYQAGSNRKAPCPGQATQAGDGSGPGSGHRAEVDSVRVAVGTLIHVATKHQANADSAETVRKKITAAVDSLPTDQLQHVIDSLFAEPAR
ncbi:hypothetical protein [Spirosoma rigui]|uniref:hypothetical protein n=1 Tax=Spirosoma rigui TaxID=564064 RepID=UPI0009B13205|nr:hypothetical protein [Spirosoma rigui]